MLNKLIVGVRFMAQLALMNSFSIYKIIFFLMFLSFKLAFMSKLFNQNDISNAKI